MTITIEELHTQIATGQRCDHPQFDTTDDALICAAPGCGHRMARPAIDHDPQALAVLAGRIGQIIAICEAA